MIYSVYFRKKTATLCYSNIERMTSSEKTRETSSHAQSTSTTTTQYSTTERICKSVPLALTHRLDVDDLFSNPLEPDDKPHLDILKQHLLLEGRLTERAALRIIEAGLLSNLILYQIQIE